MEAKERVEIIGRMASALEQLEGELIEISESISRNEKGEFDRHCTILNRFQLLVKNVVWQMSDGHFYLHGESSQYGIQTGQVISFAAEATEIIIIEKYESHTIRKTNIRHSA
jgi:hypothetical protein